jgi:hypothetical protein
MRQLAAGTDDTAGRCKLETSSEPDGPWIPAGDAAWDSIYVWGEYADFATLYVRCYEVGNAVAYAGNSPYSNVLEPS